MFGLGRRSRGSETIRRVLIVEDEPLIAFDNEHLLADAGYEIVATVDNAVEAARLLAAGGIDLVISDVTLRGNGSGIDVADAARAVGTPVLFVTGNCPVEARALAAGCLAKPYSPRDLLDAITAVGIRSEGGKPGRLPRGLTLFD